MNKTSPSTEDMAPGAQQDNDATDAFLHSLPELAQGDTFGFACHPEVPCFNACCSDLRLMLTPYDVLRLRRALALPSAEFIRLYASMSPAPDTGFPMLSLNMLDDKRKSCPFVSPKGCQVYADRPGACRTYPLGRATRLDENGGVLEQFFIVREEHCRGFEQDRTWDASGWLSDQELNRYNHFNDRYMRLMAVCKNHGARLDPKQIQMVFLAQYNLDAFRDFLERLGLFDRLVVSEERKERVLDDEEARLEFALDWLELALFGMDDNLKRKT